MSLGQRIRQLRQTRGLTQSQLGGRELSKSFISLLEKDRAQPSLGTLILLARRLEASVDALLGPQDNLPESVGEGLLALTRQAARRRDREGTVRFLETVRFLAERHGLSELGREITLQDAQLAFDDRRFGEAWASLAKVRVDADQARDFWRAGRALVMMARVKVRTREFPESQSLAEEALLLLRRARASRDPARVEALIALGTTLFYLGDYPSAIRRYEEAARSDVAQHNMSYRGQALWGIGLARRKLGDYAAAKQHLLRAKDVFEAAEELTGLIQVLKNLGDLFVEQGRFHDALRHYHHALRVMERLGRRVDFASTLTEIGRVHLAMGNVGDAAHYAGRAIEEAKAAGDPVEVAEAQVILARVAHRQGDSPAAVRLYKEAFAAFKARAMRAKMAEVARELGLLLRGRGAHAQATTYLALALKEEGKEVSLASE